MKRLVQVSLAALMGIATSMSAIAVRADDYPAVYRGGSHDDSESSSHRRIIHDGRVYEIDEDDHHRIIIRPSHSSFDGPIIIRERIIRQPVIRQPIIQAPLQQQPVIVDPVRIPQQTQQPRLLHGRGISPLNAVLINTADLLGRSGPGTVYPVVTQFAAGQPVVVTRVAGSGDGYDWYLVASGAGQYAWLRSDRLLIYDDSYQLFR